MTRNAIRFGTAALAFLAADACAADNGWFRPPDTTVQCKGLHAKVQHPQSIIATYVQTGDGAGASLAWCELQCARTPGCVAFNYYLKLDTSSSPPRRAYTCELLNNANRRIDTVADFESSGIYYAFVCYRGFPLDNYPTERYDWGTARIQQDAARPGDGFPVGQSPAHRYKP